jgi:hypothetical protein
MPIASFGGSDRVMTLCLKDGRKLMKRALRNAVVLVCSTPLILSIAAWSLFRGKENAIRVFGPGLTKAAKRSLRYWVPDIRNASEFIEFKERMKRNFPMWSLLYDVDIEEDSEDTFKINVRNCPFCEVFTFAGLDDINHYICKADWEIAEDNRGKWSFDRRHTIAAGDRLCDHTYKRDPLQRSDDKER